MKRNDLKDERRYNNDEDGNNKDETNSTTIASEEEVLESVANYFSIKANIVKLNYYVYTIIKFYFYKDNINGNTAEDVVQLVVEKFLSGKRKWYKKEGRTFKNQLFMAALSYVKNEFRKTYSIGNSNGKDQLSSKKPMIFSIFDKDGKERDDILHSIEEEDEYILSTEEQINMCYKLLESDDIALIVFDELLKVGNNNIIAAKNLGIEVKEVENAKKRIRRKLINKQ